MSLDQYEHIPTLFVLAWFVFVPAAHAQDESNRPNIVWFITEDMGPDLGTYGEPEARTPNFDRLAEQGMQFNRAFTTTPVCSSSRSSFMTGMYATSIDTHHHRSHRDDGYTLPEGVRVITDWLRPAGYHTMLGWKKKKDWNFNYEGRAGKDRPYDAGNLNNLSDRQPFFAQVQLQEAHRDFHGPKRANPDRVDLPPYYPDHPKTREIWARYLDTVAVADQKFGTLVSKLKDEGVYDNTIIFMFADHGRAMVRGKQWCYDSGLRVPLIVRWPDSLSPPSQYEKGTESDRLLSAIDITATTLWAAGVEPPMLMQGRVFFGPRAERLERKFVFGGRGRGDETEFSTRTVRSKNYRYIRNRHPERPFLQRNEYKERQYPTIDLMRKLFFEDKLNDVQEKLLAPDRPPEELYYLPEDPHEVNNLINSNKKQHVRARIRLQSALETWRVETNDQGRFSEDPAVRKKWQDRFDRRWEQFKDKSPEKYRRYKKLLEHWREVDDDRANTSHRK